MSGRNAPDRRVSLMAAVILGLMLSFATCRAATFSWPTTPAWTTGSPTNGSSQTVDYFTTGAQGISVTLANNGVTWDPAFPAQASGNARTVTGGTSTATSSLQLGTSTTAATTSYVQVTINFNYTLGANNISFNLWDIDFGGATSWVDQISNIRATALGGGVVYATTLTAGTTNALAGTGATAVFTGTAGNANTSANGDVTIGFSQTVTSISFDWANTAATTRTTQYIGISPITFTGIGTAFPEVNSSSAALMLCGGVMGFGLVRRRRDAGRSPCHSHT